MSNAGLGLKDRVDLKSEGLDALPPLTEARTATRLDPHRDPTVDGRKYAARAMRPYDSGRTRIGADGVRTVKIRGQATPPRRRPAVPVQRYDQHPDRAAQWALFLGVFMVIVAIVTGA